MANRHFQLGLSCVLVLGTLSLAGCPGTIDNPDAFQELPPCTNDDFDAEALFATSCGTNTCHQGDDPAAQLDLISPGVFGRLEDVPSHECNEFLRVDPGAPEESFLFLKITGRQPPGCGDQMPQVSFLTSEQISCLQRWIVLNVSGLADAGSDASRDAGTPDAERDGAADAVADMMSMDMTDDGGDADDATVDMDEGPVDCAPITAAGFELCSMTETACMAETVLGSGCDDVCAAAGLMCTRAVPDADPDCGPRDGAMDYADCTDQGSMSDFCVCERP